MLKNAKKKIIAGVLGISILTGAGTALAASDPNSMATQFTNWVWNSGNQVFGQALANLMIGAYAQGKTTIDNAGSQAKTNTVNSVNQYGTATTESTKAGIDTTVQAYLDKLDEVKGQLLTDLAAGDDAAIESWRSTTDVNFEMRSDAAIAALNTAVPAQAANSANALTTAADAETAAKIAELTAAINAAKAEIQALANAEAAKVNGELTQYTIDKMNAEVAAINTKAAELLASAKGTIDAASNQALSDAQSAIDGAVGGI